MQRRRQVLSLRLQNNSSSSTRARPPALSTPQTRPSRSSASSRTVRARRPQIALRSCCGAVSTFQPRGAHPPPSPTRPALTLHSRSRLPGSGLTLRRAHRHWLDAGRWPWLSESLRDRPVPSSSRDLYLSASSSRQLTAYVCRTTRRAPLCRQSSILRICRLLGLKHTSASLFGTHRDQLID